MGQFTFAVRQTGTTLAAERIDVIFTAGNEIAYLAATQVDESRATQTKSNNLLGFLNLSGLLDNGWQKAKEKSETTSSSRTAVVTRIQTQDDVLSQSGSDTTLAGTQIRAGSFTAIAGLADGEIVDPTAQIHLLGVKESDSFSETKESRSFMWQSAKGEGRSTETLRLPDIQAYGASTEAPGIGAKGVVGETEGSEQASLSPTLIAPGGITVGATDLPTTQAEAARATPGNAGSGTAPPTVKLDLKAQAASLAQQPGLAWLGDLAQRDDVDWQQIALIHDQWDYEQSGLTQEGGAVIAIAVAIVTWGWGSSLATTGTTVTTTGTTATTVGGMAVSTTTATGVTYTAAGAALNAGFTTLATQASVSLINNKGDIGQTLKDLGSSDSIKQVVTSMLTAGLTQGATQYLQSEGLLVKNLGNASFTERFATYTTKAVVGAGVQSAVMGRPLDETLKTALVSSLAQTLTSEIGDWGKGSETQVAKTLAHAVVQCAAASVQGADCGSAALGAATAELLSPLLDGLDNRTKEAGFQQTLGSAIAGMGAMLAAELTGKDALTAMNAAQMVDYYNRQLHPEEKKLIKSLAAQKAKDACQGDTSCQNQATLYWTDALERVAEASADDQAYLRTANYLNALEHTASIPGSEGQMGGVERYFADLETAANMLAPYSGNAIMVNGQVVALNGSAQTYFSATPEQRANESENYFLGVLPDPSIIPGMAERDQIRLEQASVMNGSVQPLYLAEEVFLGGPLTNKVLGALGRTLGALDVAFAGKVGASVGGNISTQQVTREGIAASLNASERASLAKLNTLSDTAEQGVLRENVTNSFFSRNGFTQLEGKCGSNNCFDGVFIKGDTVYVVETKPLQVNGAIRLDNSTGNVQLDRNWIEYSAQRLVDTGDPVKLQTAALVLQAQNNLNGKTLVKIIAGVNENGVTLVKLAK